MFADRFRCTVVLLVLLSTTIISFVNAQDFGCSTSSDNRKWIITTGQGLTVTMVRATCDIVSLKYNDQELQSTVRGTQVNSGLGKNVTSSIQILNDTTVRSRSARFCREASRQLTDAAKTIQITCDTMGLTQYYFFRPNENAIYMGTYHASDLELPELRFLARLDRSAVPTGIIEATLDGMNIPVDAEDVLRNDKNITRSKFYSSVPFIHDHVHGVKGPKCGVYMVMSTYAYETSIGGPFYRDINNKCTTVNELTFYMNSDHTRTEDYRYGFHGPYALVVTDGVAPSLNTGVNFGFFQGLSLKGFVDETKRGRVKGTIQDVKNVLKQNTVVVGFSNDQAQYWSELPAGVKAFTSPLMKEGMYTMTVYKKQLAVATTNVTVTTGSITTQDIGVTFTENPNAIWQLGEWDGTPDGFLNADKIHKMHPSDARMSKWEPLTFAVTNDSIATFPMALFRGVNDPLTLTFPLSATEPTKDRVLKIGVTLAQANGRVVVKVNDKWTSPIPTTAAVKTRGVTRGTTVGNYILYRFPIPSSALTSGTNRITLTVMSGDDDPPEPFLHAAVVFDALELD